jgi:hypothetical protein
MELQKLNVKFFVAEPDTVPLNAFIDVFHSWIQATDGVYYDVADYSHMHSGPGVVLIAPEAQIGIDESGGRRGLLYNHRGRLSGSDADRLRHVFSSALTYCRRIEDEPALDGRVKFRCEEAVFIVNDRLAAPNTEETFTAVRPALSGFLRALYGGAEVSLERDEDAGRRFGVSIRAAGRFSAAALLEELKKA